MQSLKSKCICQPEKLTRFSFEKFVGPRDGWLKSKASRLLAGTAGIGAGCGFASMGSGVGSTGSESAFDTLSAMSANEGGRGDDEAGVGRPVG